MSGSTVWTPAGILKWLRRLCTWWKRITTWRAIVKPLNAANEFRGKSLNQPGFSAETALSLAMASRLAYETGEVVERTALHNWQLDTCKFLSVGETQAFVATCADRVLVVFRGSESPGDWLANLNTLSVSQDFGRVHRGFLAAFRTAEPALQREIKTALLENPHRQLLLTGHSLGGALALLAAAEWHAQFPIAGVYTFGQPAVGKGSFPAFVESHLADRVFRFVNHRDIVPRLPPTFQHVGRLLQFDAAGELEACSTRGSLLREATATATDGDSPMLSAAEFASFQHELHTHQTIAGQRVRAEIHAEGLLRGFRDHHIDEYIRKLAACLKAGFDMRASDND